MKQDPSIKDIWFGDRLNLQIKEAETKLEVSFVATHYYDEHAARAQDGFSKCIANRYPTLAYTIEKRTSYFDTR